MRTAAAIQQLKDSQAMLKENEVIPNGNINQETKDRLDLSEGET